MAYELSQSQLLRRLQGIGALAWGGLGPTVGISGTATKIPLRSLMMKLYRGESSPTGAALPGWLQEAYRGSSQAAAAGRWFTHDPAIAQWYVREAGPSGQMKVLEVPRYLAEQYRVTNNPSAMRWSLDPANEFFLPRKVADLATVLMQGGR